MGYKSSNMINNGTGPSAVWKTKHETWEDILRKNWNNVGAIRSVPNYFQGALHPISRDENGNLIYKYVGLERSYEVGPYWHIDPNDI